MFKAEQKFVWTFDDSTGQVGDTGETELGFVFKNVIELSFYKWERGNAMIVKVVKCVAGEEGRKSFLVYERWFYDDQTRDGHLALPGNAHPMLAALANNEVRGKTAEDMAYLLFWEAVKLENFFKKFFPKYWQNNAKYGFIADGNFPEPSPDPEMWMKPHIIVPYL
ncbi:hypothetical protein HZB94_02110 [Candidatus Falkowbacteria bacterium]|nr:hypothetical protein [Candidatus Falkowbacteria bacterium]